MSPSPRSTRPDTAGRPDEYFVLGFEYYLAGRHAIFCGYVQVAAHLFHIGVELILKSKPLSPAYEQAQACLHEARKEVEAKLGPEVVTNDPDRIRVDPSAADACLEPHNKRAEELKDGFGHNIPRLWEAFKSDVGNPDLDRFDPLITKLHHWEDIRYPTFVRSRGNVISYSPLKGQRSRTTARELLNRYDVSDEEVDELVSALIAAIGYSPQWIRMVANRRRKGPGLETYLQGNRHAR